MNAAQYVSGGFAGGMFIMFVFNYLTTFQSLKDTRDMAMNDVKRHVEEIREKNKYILECIEQMTKMSTRSTVAALRLRSNTDDDMGAFLRQYGEYLRGNVNYEDVDFGTRAKKYEGA